MRFRLPWWLPPALAALVLRAVGASVLRPWHDEYFTVWASQLRWDELMAALRWDSGPPGLYVLVKVLSFMGLEPLVASRVLSVAAGVLAAVLVGLAARGLFSPAAGTAASFFFAVHPLAVMWGSEGRAYGLLSLAVAASLWALGELEAGRQSWVWLASCLAFGLYTHALGLVWLLAVLAYGLCRRQKTVLYAAGAAAASFSPWLPVMLQQPPEAVAWMGSSFREVPTWLRWLGAFRLLPPVAGWGYTLEAPEPAWYWQVVAAVATVWALALARGWVWALLLLPAAALTFGAWLGLPVYYPGRGEAVLLAPFAALLAGGTQRRGRALAASLVALGLGGSAAVLGSFRQAPPRPEQEVARILLRQGTSGVLVTTGWWWLGMRHNLPPSWRVIHLPEAALQHPGWFVPGRERVTEEELAEVERRLEDAGNRGQGVGILLTPGLPEAGELRFRCQRWGWRCVRLPGGELCLPGGGGA